ncbi:DUF2269 family protein [Brevibacillus migulae]|uniref:DUF2269 family protein n=1 Tax=Brevibacillus migulae TaxID=1644114 RepID=UPI00106EC99D|nr:DUF2269 family protein [Brevibacillus migulae]
MSTLYPFLLYIHIVSAIMSIGPFFVLIPMVKKLREASEQEEQAYVNTFRFVIQLAKHAGHVLVVSGILLLLSGPWAWTTSWVLMTIIVMVSSLFFLARAFSPTLRKLRDSQQDRAKLVQKLQRAIWIYLALLGIMLWFMVTKPVLW